MIPTRRIPPPETWVVVALRAMALMLVPAAFLLELSLPAGTIAAVFGTFAGSVLAVWLARSRVRLPVVWAAAGLCSATALALGALLVDWSFPAESLGPHGAMIAADVVRFGLLAVSLSLAIRTTAERVPAFAIAELCAVVLALAGVVAAHRDGAINHPRLISDWAWTHGIDPVVILLLVGIGTLTALLLATLHEQKNRGPRVLIHLLLLLLLAASTAFLVHTKHLLKPLRGEGDKKEDKGRGGKDAKNDKKGGGKPDKGKDGQGGGGGGQSQDPLPFRNENMSQSTAPVAVVLLHDDYSPPLGYFYFRQNAFSQFNGSRLVQSTRDDVDRDIMEGFPSKKEKVLDAPQPGAERQVVRTTVAMLADHAKPFGLETPIDFSPKESPDPARFTRAYDVTSAALAMRYEDLLGKKPGVRAWTDEQRAAYTQLPDDPRYKELADQIVKSSLRTEYQKDPFAQAIAVSAWLGKNSKYSIKSKHADDKDPTGDFLFGDRIGYCVHFAHAAAYLLRARGLPTRIAEGYVADESRRGNGSAILIRQKDAHAWAELYLDGFGWIIVDVSPQTNLDPPDAPPDPDLQRMLGELARGDKTAGKTNDKKPLPIDFGKIGRTFGEILLAFFVAFHGLRLWRRYAPYFAGPRSIHRVAYRAALDAAAEAGMRREVGETRERFARRVEKRVPSFEPLTRAHVARAWGSERLASLNETRHLWLVSTNQVNGQMHILKRIVTWLIPIWWLFSR